MLVSPVTTIGLTFPVAVPGGSLSNETHVAVYDTSVTPPLNQSR